MHGDLADTTLAAICRALAAGGATGRLLLDRTDTPASVTLHDGAVSGVRSSQPRARLAGRLAGGGHLDELTLARVLQDLRRSMRGAGGGGGVVDDIALARALLERGLVDPLVVEDVLVGQIVDGMVELGTWRTGRYEFRPVAAERSGTNVVPRLDVETLLKEVGRREEELAGLPRSALRADTVPYLRPSDADPGEELGADAATVLRAIDDRRSIAELAGVLGYGGYDLACILSELTVRGVVALATSDDEVGPAPDPAPMWSEPQAAPAPDTQGRPAVTPSSGPEPTAGGNDAIGRAPDPADPAGGDADISEFLRELSWLAQGDDAPTTRRSSPRPASDPAGRSGEADDTAPGAAADGDATRPGPPRGRRDQTGTDPTRRDNGQRRRRRRLFGRG
jgi:hypothetical protein